MMGRLKQHRNYLICLLILSSLFLILSETSAQELEASITQLKVQIVELPPLDISQNYVVAWSPDGRALALGGNRDIWLYDSLTYIETAHFIGHTDGISALAFSPDSELLVSSSWDKTVRIWDTESFRAISVIEEYDRWITSIAWHPDEELLAVISWDWDNDANQDKTVLIWDLVGKEVQSSFPFTRSDGSATFANSVSWHPNGQQIAVVGNATSGRIWDTLTANLMLEFPADGAHVISWSSDGKFILTDGGGGGASNHIGRIWDAATGKLLQVFQEHEDEIVSLEFHPNGTMLATNSLDGTTLLWDTVTWEMLAKMPNGIFDKEPIPFTNYAYTLDWSPDGKYLASVGNDNLLRIWDVTPLLDHPPE